MAVLRLFLADRTPSDSKFRIQLPSPVRTKLLEHLNAVLQVHRTMKNPAIHGVVVEYTSTPPALAAHDLLVYFVENWSDSVVKKFWVSLGGQAPKGHYSRLIMPRKPNVVHRLGHVGSTLHHHSGQCSEVYLGPVHVQAGNKEDARFIANATFHELMHNKTNLAENQLHNRPRLHLGRIPVPLADQPKQGDLELMAAHFGAMRPQWPGGF